MTLSLYLVIERQRVRYRGLRIAKVSKRRPLLARPSEQALIKVGITIPDTVLEPRVVYVEIKPEHIVAPTVTVSSQQA